MLRVKIKSGESFFYAYLSVVYISSIEPVPMSRVAKTCIHMTNGDEFRVMDTLDEILNGINSSQTDLVR